MEQFQQDFELGMERMRVRVRSPDTSVTATFTTGTGLNLEFDETKFRRHTEATLAQQVRTTLIAVGKGREEATRQLMSRAMTAANATEPGAKAIDPPGVEPGLQDCIDRAEGWHSDSRGHVEIGVRGDREISVWMLPGTLGDLSVSANQLATGCLEAFSGAQRNLQRKVKNAIRAFDREKRTSV